MAPAGGQRVQVYCRLRPGSTREKQAGLSCSTIDDKTVAVTSDSAMQRQQERTWDYDGVYAPDVDQQRVYDEVGAPILDAVMQGYNGTVLAYGQTGTGKTHTLLNVGEDRPDAGLVPRLVAALFVAIKVDVRHVYKVKASFAQIYNEQIDDLLRPKNTNLRVKPRGASHEVDGLAALECKSPSDLLAFFDQGRRQLVYAETKMNKHSSRSHAVLQLMVSRRERVMDGASAHGGSMIATQTSGKLTVVDLAGSERVKRSGADEDISGRRMKEAININTSLLGLSNVMKALSTQSPHIPYRDSKLTHMLSDALGGNCKTSLVVCASPASADVSETTGTLEFGARAMKVRTNAIVNSNEVTLDAAALAADLTEVLQLQAEGAITGQMLAMEAELRERQSQLAELEAMAETDRKRREGEMNDAITRAESVRAEAMRAGEEADSLRSLLTSAEARADAANARGRELELQLRDEVTDREELEAALAVKARAAQAAEAAAEEAAVNAHEAEAEARAAAAAAQRELIEFKRNAASALAAHNAEQAQAASEARARSHAERAEADAKLSDAHAEAAGEAAALRDELATLDAQLACALGALGEVEEESVTESRTLRHRLRVSTAGVVTKESEAARAHAELAAARLELTDVREALGHTRRDLGNAGEAAGELRAAHESELLGMRLQVHHAIEAQAAAVSTVEAAVTPLQELVSGLHERLASEQTASAAKVHALKEAFASLRDEYERTLSELHASDEERARLAAQCLAVEQLLADESHRQDELARSLEEELTNREVELQQALEESHDKSERLEEAADDAAAAALTTEALQRAVDDAESDRDDVEGRLRVSEDALHLARTERSRLEAEVESLGAITASELADAEAARLAEVRALLGEAESTEARRTAEKAALQDEAAACEAALARAHTQLTEARATGGQQRRDLWQRLKRQAVVQAAAVRTLQQSLSASRADQQRALDNAGDEMKTARSKLSDKDSELEGLRASLRSAETQHAKALAASGVTVLKHGRKGKPHPRHVRCVTNRLEWGRPDEKGRGYEKGMLIHEIRSVEGGLASETARRSGKGRNENLFLCVLARSRTLDLEFATRAARDEWWTTLDRWREAALPGSTGRTPSFGRAPAHAFLSFSGSAPSHAGLAMSATPAAAGLAISATSANALLSPIADGFELGATTPPSRTTPEQLGHTHVMPAARSRISPLPTDRSPA